MLHETVLSVVNTMPTLNFLISIYKKNKDIHNTSQEHKSEMSLLPFLML